MNFQPINSSTRSNFEDFLCRPNTGSGTSHRHNKGLPFLQTAGTGGPCVPRLPGQLGNSTGWKKGGGGGGGGGVFMAAHAWWDPDKLGNDQGNGISLNSLSVYYQVMVTYTNFTGAKSGEAVLCQVREGHEYCSCPAAFPSGCVRLDAHAGTLIENAVRVQFQVFFLGLPYSHS